MTFIVVVDDVACSGFNLSAAVASLSRDGCVVVTVKGIVACMAFSPGGVVGGTDPARYVVRQPTDVIDSETLNR